MTELKKRWIILQRKQRLAEEAAMKREGRSGMGFLREKIPEGTREQLDWAFELAFSTVFRRGSDIIEKTYSSKALRRGQLSRELALQLEGDGKYFDASLGRRQATGMVISSLEGLGLGALGIGLPDIVLFVAMLLRGVQDTALGFGYDIKTQAEKMYILKMLECSMLSGEAWQEADRALEALGQANELPCPTPLEFREQLKRTASAFATDLLILKFIQGLPIVGLLGGLGNPVYYRRVMSYGELKYQRRYIYALMKKAE